MAVTVDVLVFQVVIKWQIVPKGLTDPSGDRVDHLLRYPLRTQKALTVKDLWYWLCCELCVRSERGSQIEGDKGLFLNGFKGQLGTERNGCVTLGDSLCEYQYTCQCGI